MGEAPACWATLGALTGQCPPTSVALRRIGHVAKAWTWSPSVKSILKCMLHLTTGTSVRKAEALRSFGEEEGQWKIRLPPSEADSFIRAFICSFTRVCIQRTGRRHLFSARHLLGARGLVMGKAQSLPSRREKEKKNQLWSPTDMVHFYINYQEYDTSSKFLSSSESQFPPLYPENNATPLSQLWHSRQTSVTACWSAHDSSCANFVIFFQGLQGAYPITFFLPTASSKGKKSHCVQLCFPHCNCNIIVNVLGVQ